jgi:predicted transcriptional regulator of viral defense system
VGHYWMVTKRIPASALSKMDVSTAAGWRAAGLSETRLTALIREGELVKVRYGVYATASFLARAETDPCLRHGLEVVAATTRTRKGVASHHSAARMLGLDLLNGPQNGTVTLTVPSGTRIGPYGRANVVRHSAELPAEHVIRPYGVPVTTAARTVIDIARTSTFTEGVVVADSALRQRHTYKTELRRVLARCERWPGICQARRVVDFADGLAESVLESCARVTFRDQGLPAPELQVHITGIDRTVIARVDFCWRHRRTIAEADGLLKYESGGKAIAELKRDRLLREAGYEVIHFTWQELFGDPALVAARIRTAFDRARRLAANPSGRG